MKFYPINLWNFPRQSRDYMQKRDEFTNYGESGYLNLLERIIETGNYRKPEGEEGRFELFAEPLRFDLTGNKLPLMTTKKVFFKSLAVEMLWFLSGEQDTGLMKDYGVKIWDQWANSEGIVGPMYGYLATNWPNGRNPIEVIPRLKNPNIGVANHSQASVCGVGYISDKYQGYSSDPLYKIWYDMIRRCYSEKSSSYAYYGGRGVFVDSRWHDYSVFADDVKKLPNWPNKKASWKSFQLDKDYYGSNCYSKDTCVWIHENDNRAYSQGSPLVATHEDHGEILVASAAHFCAEWDLHDSAISRLLSAGDSTTKHKGWSFKAYKGDKLVRYPLPINQYAEVMDSLANRPEARSHVVTMWRPDAVRFQSIKACHVLLQFYRYGDEISLVMFQRSCDTYLGVAFNVAQYSLLVHMIAHQLDCTAKEFVWIGGDVHVYENHVDQVREQLTKPILDVPTIEFLRQPDDLFSYRFEDFKVNGYAHAGYVPAEVSAQGKPGCGVRYPVQA